MPDPPNWAETQIDRTPDDTLTQEAVIEALLDADRPSLSIRELQARVDPDASTATVRNRLEELHEFDIVATETAPDAVTRYYVDDRESTRPRSLDGDRLLTDSPQDRLSIGPFSVSSSAGLAMLGAASLALVVLGGVLGAIGVALLFDVGEVAEVLGSLLVIGAFALLVSLVKLLGAGVVVLVTDRVTR